MAVPVLRATGAVAASIDAITPAMPTGVLANDVLLLFLETATEVITVSGGTETWAQVLNSPQNTGGQIEVGTRLTIFWARASQDAPTSPTTSDSGDHQQGVMAAFSGCVTTGDPWDVGAGDIAAASTAISIPGATTTVADCLVVAAVAGALPDADGTTEHSGWANADLASVAEIIDNTTLAGNGGSLGVATGAKATAGAYGATTATKVNSSKQGRISIALRPPPAGPSGPFPPWRRRPSSLLVR